MYQGLFSMLQEEVFIQNIPNYLHLTFGVVWSKGP